MFEYKICIIPVNEEQFVEKCLWKKVKNRAMQEVDPELRRGENSIIFFNFKYEVDTRKDCLRITFEIRTSIFLEGEKGSD